MYQLTETQSIIYRDDGMWIPTDPANTDYQQYLAWLSEGNTPEPYVAPPPPIPASVTRFQARAALALAGYFEAVDTYMTSLPHTNIQRRAWEDAVSFDRTSATLVAMAQMLNLTEEQVDELFITAAQISA